MSDFDRAAAFIRRSLRNRKSTDDSRSSNSHKVIGEKYSRHTSAPAILVRRADNHHPSSPLKEGISRPMVNPAEKLKIWEGRGPLLTLGDISAPIFEVPVGAQLLKTAPREPPLTPTRGRYKDSMSSRMAEPTLSSVSPASLQSARTPSYATPQSTPFTQLQRTASQETSWSDFINVNMMRESEFLNPAPLKMAGTVSPCENSHQNTSENKTRAYHQNI